MKLLSFIIFLLLCGCRVEKEPVDTTCRCLEGAWIPSEKKCEIRLYITDPCTMDYTPVCGCNKKTYSNECRARQEGVKIVTPGECKK